MPARQLDVLAPPVVLTYISRQAGGRRKLRADDDAALVSALRALAVRRRWELNVLVAEGMSIEDQLRVAARTTVRTPLFPSSLADSPACR